MKPMSEAEVMRAAYDILISSISDDIEVLLTAPDNPVQVNQPIRAGDIHRVEAAITGITNELRAKLKEWERKAK
jgi:hypothetical protein